MKEAIQEAVNLLNDGQPCVLATVVRTKGSTPQKSGAMLLVREDGTGVGTLGGGCVEGDIWFAAREILHNHGGPEFKNYYLNEDIAARDGLVCGGTMYFYLEPFWEGTDFLEIGAEVLEAYEGGDAVALATVVSTWGSSPRPVGSQLAVDEDGRMVGSVSGGCIEGAVVSEAHEVIADGAPRLLQYGVTDELAWEVGLACGGRVEVFVERLE